MSAFIVSNDHIDYLVSAALTYGRGGYVKYGDVYISSQNANETGARLISENTNSVQYRYPDEPINALPGPIATVYAIDYKYRPFLHVTPVQTLKALSCYEYQSCEHPGWETSSAKRFCDQLRNAAIRALSGYDDAQYEINR
jgi:hypothetical protein